MKNRRSHERAVSNAVRLFWEIRHGQASRQRKSARPDQGARSAVTGGKQMDGFVSLVRALVVDSGMDQACVHVDARLELPGYFRPEKKWDLLVVENGTLVAAIEFKSQVGPSFGNNFNNRSEEAIGTAQDIWTAYREGAFPTANRPWLGYLMMLEDCPRSTAPIAVRQPHFSVFPEFVASSYSVRYQLLLKKLMRERLYDSACFLMSKREAGLNGHYTYPDKELSFAQFASSLIAKVTSYLTAK